MFQQFWRGSPRQIQVTMEQKRNRCPYVAPQSKYRPGLANGCNLHLGADDFMLFIDDDDLGVQRFLGFPPKKIPQAPLMCPIYPSPIGVVLYPLN